MAQALLPPIRLRAEADRPTPGLEEVALGIMVGVALWYAVESILHPKGIVVPEPVAPALENAVRPAGRPPIPGYYGSRAGGYLGGRRAIGGNVAGAAAATPSAGQEPISGPAVDALGVPEADAAGAREGAGAATYGGRRVAAAGGGSSGAGGSGQSVVGEGRGSPLSSATSPRAGGAKDSSGRPEETAEAKVAQAPAPRASGVLPASAVRAGSDGLRNAPAPAGRGMAPGAGGILSTFPANAVRPGVVLNPRAQPPSQAAIDAFNNFPQLQSRIQALTQTAQAAIQQHQGIIPNATAKGDIPPEYLALYQSAGERFGVPWQVIAGIGRVESDHGRDPAAYSPNYAGAVGPMQFLPSTFRGYSWASGSSAPNILSPHDSIYSAAALLKNDGAPGNLHGAIFDYNHSDSYVNLVMSWARRYGYSG